MSKESVNGDDDFAPTAEVIGRIGEVTLGSAIVSTREDSHTYFRSGRTGALDRVTLPALEPQEPSTQLP